MSRLGRMLNPQSIAVVGGGAWCASIMDAADRIGYTGTITPIHPSGKLIAGRTPLQCLSHLKSPPDASFIGVNRNATVEVVSQLKSLGAGGAICFASGFSEAQAELSDGADLQTALLEAAGEMPILGPNCYGFINAFDKTAIWPDQHGCTPVAQGVAILTQSSNIAISLTMQKRALPIGYMITCGNQAQLSQADIAFDLLDDSRVTAVGLHVEGFSDIRAWERFASKANALGKSVVVLKVGKSDQAKEATVSHTASLAGSDAGADALIKRLGFVRVDSLSVFLETLKLLHVSGPLSGNSIASISCSGGEASLVADTGKALDIDFPALTDSQRAKLATALGPKVALANPLDYHTYIWRDHEAMGKAWSAIDDDALNLTMTIVDYPRDDLCNASDWECATLAAISTRTTTGKPTAVVATLPELLPEPVAQRLIENDVVPLMGLGDALQAIKAASSIPDPYFEPLTMAPTNSFFEVMDEAQAKKELSDFGVEVPKGVMSENIHSLITALTTLETPVVLKGMGAAHKSELGLVALNLNDCNEVKSAAESMQSDCYLLEEMVRNPRVELIVGVNKDPAHGFVLTIGAGGVLTEILSDTVSLLLPTNALEIHKAIDGLKVAKIMRGYREKPPIDFDSLIHTILAVQSYVIANAAVLEEVEINPLICTDNNAIAADALIRKARNVPN